jgi:Big-like domain-containing protein
MRNLVLLFVAVLGLTACGGGGGDSSPAGNNKTIASITMADGNNQSATVGTELPNPLVALILNKAGQPIAGQVVNFKIISGGGAVFAGAATSDANGFARERWTLGTTAGAQKVEVRAVDSTGVAVVYATFEANAVAGEAQSIGIASGDSQSAQQLQPLSLPVTAVVRDAYGNRKAGVSVTFTPNNGGAALPRAAITNEAGEASAAWTLGQPTGVQTLSAAVTGLPPATFSATATPAPATAATAIARISGDLQTVVQHSMLPLGLQVIVTDVLGNPVPGTPVTFSAAAGSDYVTPATVSTDSTGKAGWAGYIHAAGQQKVDASIAGAASVTFDINVTASSHLYDGLYLCRGYFSSSPSSFSLIILGGLINNDNGFAFRGTVNEADGTMSAGKGINFREILSGQLVVDSLQRATGAGTYSGTSLYTPNPVVGSWTCERQ